MMIEAHHTLKHLAVIMDGNRRWAIKHNKDPFQGHLHGAKSAMKLIKNCLNYDIPYISLFAFSKENWARSQAEVVYLWESISYQLEETTSFLIDNHIKFLPIGDKNNWPEKSKILLERLCQQTKHGHKMTLLVALDYSGQWDIQQAVIKAQELNCVSEWTSFLLTAGIPDPDILIRTGYEKRISNFYLYNLAYTELFFPKVYWPDFDQNHLMTILDQYDRRERRFGVDKAVSEDHYARSI